MKARGRHILAAATLVAASPLATQLPAGATPTCMGKPATITKATSTDSTGGWIVGTEGDDVIVGTDNDRAETIQGLGGDDVICALGGTDIVDAGLGNDRVDAGGGGDEVLGDFTSGTDRGPKRRVPQNDFLIGGPGDDQVQGGGGKDTLEGGEGADYLVGDYFGRARNGFIGKYRPAGPDRIEGGDGNDYLLAGDGADVLDGGVGDDSLKGEGGNDKLDGGPDGDGLDGGPDKDSCLNGESLRACELPKIEEDEADDDSSDEVEPEPEPKPRDPKEIPPGAPLSFTAMITNEGYFEAGNNVSTLVDLRPNGDILVGHTWSFTNNSPREYEIRVRVIGPDADCGGPGYVLQEVLGVTVEPGETKSVTKIKSLGDYGPPSPGVEADDYCLTVMTWPNTMLADGESIIVEADFVEPDA